MGFSLDGREFKFVPATESITLTHLSVHIYIVYIIYICIYTYVYARKTGQGTIKVKYYFLQRKVHFYTLSDLAISTDLQCDLTN